MSSEDTRRFAQALMREVWEPFKSAAMPAFYHADVVGHHRRADGPTQDLTYADVANRLDWDATTSANAVYTIEAIVAEDTQFAIRFRYTADFLPAAAKTDVEVMYFYRLTDGKIAEFWVLGSAEFDYNARGTTGMPTT